MLSNIIHMAMTISLAEGRDQHDHFLFDDVRDTLYGSFFCEIGGQMFGRFA